MQTNEPKRIVYLDTLKIFAIFAMILLHVSARAVTGYPADSIQFFNGVAVDGITRWCVPVFVMISGALFLNPSRPQPIKKIWTKNIARLVTAFLFWSFLYALYACFVADSYSLKTFLARLVMGEYHMWFVVMIAALYALVPALRLIAQDEAILKYSILIGLSFMFVSAYAGIMPGKEIVSKVLGNISLNMGYVSYFLLGYYLTTIKKRSALGLIALGFVGYLITLLGTMHYSLQAGTFNSTFYSYQTLNVALMATSIFLLFRNIADALDRIPERMKTIISKLGNLSMGAYLIHIFILNAFKLSPQTGLFPEAIAWALLIFIISYACAFVLRMIPLVGKYIA